MAIAATMVATDSELARRFSGLPASLRNRAQPVRTCSGSTASFVRRARLY